MPRPKKPCVTSRLTVIERQRLRRAGLRKEQIKDLPPGLLARWTRLPRRRCEQLVALLQFQSLDSVGPATAADLWALGYRSVAALRRARPRRMYDRMCALAGQPLDPCVEDVFRAAVAQAREPGLPPEQRNWWYWRSEREAPASTRPRVSKP
jgi:hypothetical protein